MTKIAINGFGRIGRLVFKIGLEKGLNIVAINDLASLDNLAYLLKYDSAYGVYDKKVEMADGMLKVDGKKIKVFSQSDPLKLPWKDLGVDVVVDCTGIFKDHVKAELHLKAGAKRVLISAPSKDPDITVVYGVNHKDLKKEHKIISVASCTTNCLAPVAKVLDDNFGVKRGFMTTVHAYTSSQKIVDSPDKKFRRGRAAAYNIVPTTSGATSATAKVIPKLEGKMDGVSLRVPIVVGSIVDFVAELEKEATKEQINEAMKKAADSSLKGVLKYSEDEIVSSDIVKSEYSSIYDSLSTQVIGNMVKVLAWYDNEYGYSCRMVDVIKSLK
jgi:glyceraldehyde-3-phosphate dehydrogenase type I